MVLDDLLQDLVHLGALALHDLLGALDRLGDALLDQLVDDERLEQLDRHRLGQAALVQAQLRAHHDDRAAGVVDALAEQVLAEPALLALEHVREALERPLAATPDGLGAPPVVEQRVHRLLQHALLVPEDDLRCLVLDQLGEPVVPVDHPAIQVVQVARGEPPAVERHQRPEIGRDHGNHVQDHPGRVVRQVTRIARAQERIHDLEPLQHLLLAVLAGLGGHARPELLRQLADVDPAQQLAHRRGADVGAEGGVALLTRLGADGEVLVLVQELVGLELLLAGLDDDVARVVDDPLEVPERDVDQVPHRRRQRLEEPDVRHRHAELDVAHALAPDLAQRHLDAATVADDPAVPDPLVLPAMALPVLHRTEDALAEEAVLFRLERPIVDRLRLGDLAPRPPGALALELQALTLLGVARAPDLLGARDADADIVEARALGLAPAAKINHVIPSIRRRLRWYRA